MQNTFSQSGNDSKWFSRKSFFKIGIWHSRPPRDPPPFMVNTILNFHFDYWHTSLNHNIVLRKRAIKDNEPHNCNFRKSFEQSAPNYCKKKRERTTSALSCGKKVELASCLERSLPTRRLPSRITLY